MALKEHPRVCGENFQRGTADVSVWNTPAYAGKTLHDQRVSELKPDFSITSSDNKNTTTGALGESNQEHLLVELY